MKLRKPCEHDKYDEHPLVKRFIDRQNRTEFCPGGVFLPDDTLEVAAKGLQDWDEDNGYDWWASDSSVAEEYRRYYRNGVQTVLDALTQEPS